MSNDFDKLFEQLQGPYIDGSSVIVRADGLSVGLASGYKCQRCWKILQEVGEWREFPGACLRCVDATLVKCTGYDLEHHAIKRWNAAYQSAKAQGMSNTSAEVYAASWNSRIIPFIGDLANYEEPVI
jgi:DNA-directed RNA polymerase subunit RPC12/RpoP